jgi:hypothetical protein
MVSATLSRNQMVISGRKVQLWEEIKKKMTLLRAPASSPWKRGDLNLRTGKRWPFTGPLQTGSKGTTLLVPLRAQVANIPPLRKLTRALKRTVFVHFFSQFHISH